MKRKTQKHISRRDFLKLGAAGAGSLAASNLVMWLSGCTSGTGGEPVTLTVAFGRGLAGVCPALTTMSQKAIA